MEPHAIRQKTQNMNPKQRHLPALACTFKPSTYFSSCAFERVALCGLALRISLFSSSYTLHFLNLLDLVLGVVVGLCGLLLFLKWQMMSLIWLCDFVFSLFSLFCSLAHFLPHLPLTFLSPFL